MVLFTIYLLSFLHFTIIWRHTPGTGLINLKAHAPCDVEAGCNGRRTNLFVSELRTEALVSCTCVTFTQENYFSENYLLQVAGAGSSTADDKEQS